MEPTCIILILATLAKTSHRQINPILRAVGRWAVKPAQPAHFDPYQGRWLSNAAESIAEVLAQAADERQRLLHIKARGI